MIPFLYVSGVKETSGMVIFEIGGKFWLLRSFKGQFRVILGVYGFSALLGNFYQWYIFWFSDNFFIFYEFSSFPIYAALIFTVRESNRTKNHNSKTKQDFSICIVAL